jgi:hypothetical protein
MSWKLARDTADGFFGQCVVIAMTAHHRIIVQTAGHDPDVLDCPPRLIATGAERSAIDMGLPRRRIRGLLLMDARRNTVLVKRNQWARRPRQVPWDHILFDPFRE